MHKNEIGPPHIHNHKAGTPFHSMGYILCINITSFKCHREANCMQYNCMPNLLYIIRTVIACGTMHYILLATYCLIILYIQNVKLNLITLAKMGVVYSSTVL